MIVLRLNRWKNAGFSPEMLNPAAGLATEFRHNDTASPRLFGSVRGLIPLANSYSSDDWRLVRGFRVFDRSLTLQRRYWDNLPLYELPCSGRSLMSRQSAGGCFTLADNLRSEQKLRASDVEMAGRRSNQAAHQGNTKSERMTSQHFHLFRSYSMLG